MSTTTGRSRRAAWRSACATRWILEATSQPTRIGARYSVDVADSRKVIHIAGPNGAGKTTFAREFLPNDAALPVFINADLIAAGLSPFNPGSPRFVPGG
jgi:type II secretory pathway predicted ATPase ExeA